MGSYPSTASGGGHTIQDEGVSLPRETNVSFKGAAVQVTDNPGNQSTDVSISGQLYSAVTDTPEAHGAKRDGRLLTSVSMANASNVLACNSETPFVPADVGKSVHVRMPSTPYGLSTTITGYTDSTHVTLNTVAPMVITNQPMVYGTDDTAAVIACVAAAQAACIANQSYYYEMVPSNGIYVLSSPATKGGATLGNAQVPIPPNHPSSGQKVITRLGGAHDSATVAHWDQTVPQLSGAVFFSTLMAQVSDGTYGVPSVIGGPTVDLTVPITETFSNHKIILDGCAIVTPFNPSLMGYDLRRMAQVDPLNYSVQGFATPDADGGSPNFSTKPTNSNSVGLYLPRMNNNDSCNIGVGHCEGFYYALGFSDHLTAQKLLAVYCDTAFWVNNVAGAPQHGAVIQYASVEACNRVIDTSAGAAASYPLTIVTLDLEIITGPYDINDVNNSLRGDIGFVNIGQVRNPRINGGKHLRVIDLLAARGMLSGSTSPLLPGLPKSGGGTTAITAITQANPAVITATGHGLTTGNVATITGVSGPMVSDVNGQFNVTVVDANNFSIPVNTTSHAYSAGGGVVNHAYVPWRDAMVIVNGGTVSAITVDGVATGLTSGPVIVPSGRKLELTYTVAPSLVVSLQ